MKLHERTSEHKLALAKIKEIPDQTFGLKEVREELLNSGASSWLSWAATMGTRTLKIAERDYVLNILLRAHRLII